MRDDENSWPQIFREWRHDPCLMRPVSAIFLALLCLSWFIAAILQFPGLVIGVLLSGIAARFQFVIEFLYPTGLGRWVHLLLVKTIERSRHRKADDKNRGFHSRAIETRIEVVKGRVWIHPLPQLLDNLGYLIVSCPNDGGDPVVHTSNTPLGKIKITNEEESRIVACVVDCGDADAVVRQLELISEMHYNERKIHIQSILSTHKHHDHTAGNKELLEHESMSKSLKVVYGGAVEKVPHCNFPLADGDPIPLPKYGANIMDDLVEMEAIATPAHTRGSITYALRPKTQDASACAFLFTGDTMFCGGGGVPFESDVDKDQEQKNFRMNSSSFIKASAAGYAVERCFAEILFRCVKNTNVDPVAMSERVLVLPGHEYTHELLTRQLTQTTGESCKWKNFSPAVYFETVSQLYVSLHRRALPHSSGKLLNIPSTINREFLINPHYRCLKRRGEVVLNAVRLWHRHFAQDKVPEDFDVMEYSNGVSSGTQPGIGSFEKSPSSSKSWNLDSSDVSSSVFTTVYAFDLDSIIDDLNSGSISRQTAAERLKDMKSKVHKPIIGRRPIPATLPSDHAVYTGLLGLALLGSSPTALTISDSRLMNLPPPVNTSSDLIGISKKRLVLVLQRLGLIGNDSEGRRLVAMIHQLWKEANESNTKIATSDLELRVVNKSTYDSVDVETSTIIEDQVELGVLKWLIYGIPSKAPTFASQYCIPCSKQPVQPYDKSHPVSESGMRPHSGELVRHDVFSCKLCRSATGCPMVVESEEVSDQASDEFPFLKQYGSTITDEADGEEPYVEVATILQEAERRQP